MEYNDFKKLNVGDNITIKENPISWTSHNYGRCGTDRVKYPYTFTIVKFAYLKGFFNHISIICQNGYGWSIEVSNYEKFEINKKSRRSRIENLNI